MRVLQLIDSMEVGGAERIAVNYANALHDRIDFSGIVATRKEGALRVQIAEQVFFECLNKKFTFDLSAIFRLKSICKAHQVEWVHAHGTSYFTAFLLKLFCPKIKILWHEHAGARSEERSIHNFVLWVLSRFFCGIIVVNHDLELWCRKKLGFSQVIYLPNFTIFNNSRSKKTILKGISGKRIVCLANLRHPKNHKLLLEVAIKLKQIQPEWTFHLVGKNQQDAYARELKSIISAHNLHDTVFLYDICDDIDHILEQASIGVLASSSEGLPVALLEYGMHEKSVVVTDVGEMPQVVEDGVSGFVVRPDAAELFYNALLKLIVSEDLRKDFGTALKKTIMEQHSEEAVVAKYLKWLNDLEC